MADKATLLQSVPPVINKASTPGLTPSDFPAVTKAGAEVQPDVSPGISSFQAVTYGSFVLSFILAGFAAVVLFRKAMDVAERRFSHSCKTLAIAGILVALHGFFATYIYTRYLRDEISTAPVSLTLLLWVVLGLTVGYLTNRLLELKEKIKTAELVIDTIFWGIVFALITLAVSPATNANLSLVFSLLALIFYTVPLARFFIAFKAVKLRHAELQQAPIQWLLYSLVFLPALPLVFSVLYVFKAVGPDAMLLVANLMSFSFMLMVSMFILGAIKASKGTSSEAASEEAAPTAAPAATMDPLVQELLAEEEEKEKNKAVAAAEPKNQPKNQPKSEPTRQIRPAPTPKIEKPARPITPNKPSKLPVSAEQHSGQPKAPPKKPSMGDKDSDKAAPNTPPQIKAPAKPKKRF
ncbi:MAG: hypothetical protein ACNA77_00370 [Opitutales bacterium]